ncbi:MAG: STAS domain-containing protein [Deltaproteobacteria bacterium]|nr:STAS domain-containing protein [Deltaproteobacteria bacterium]
MKKAARKKNGTARVAIEGEMNIYRAAELKKTLLDGLEASPALEVDLSGVEEMDTSGIQILALARMEAARLKKQMKITAASQAASTLIELYNMAEFLGAGALNADDSRTGETRHGE